MESFPFLFENVWASEQQVYQFNQRQLLSQSIDMTRNRLVNIDAELGLKIRYPISLGYKLLI